MKKIKNKKRVIAWIVLIILTINFLTLNYIKFFGTKNPNIEEHPVENSTATAINTALKDIVTNFNNSQEIKAYAEQNIMIKATLNQFFIYISYSDGITTTYEFSYSNLKLDITIENEKENMERFEKIYKILIKAAQKRIGNTENIDDLIDEILNNNLKYNGIIKEENEKTIHYQMDITKKIINNQEQ